MKKLFIVFLFLFLLFPAGVGAKIGVGVGTGKIVVENELKAGMIYQLPPLTIINTGDVPSDYVVSTSYFDTQPELRPPLEWFTFSPEDFRLDPGQVQVVQIKVNLPLKTVPGKYFTYLEGRPIKKSEDGKTSIGIAAAAKLYFTIAPANFIQAVYYKIASLWKIYSPWTDRAGILILVMIVVFFFKRFFNLQIRVKKPVEESKNE